MPEAVLNRPSKDRAPRRRRKKSRSSRKSQPDQHSHKNTKAADAQECSNGEFDFDGLGLSQELLDAVRRAGFCKPTDIQRQLIPHAIAGKDCLGQARTGTGKTAAFTLPMLQMVKPGNRVQALVLVPTRELAAQVGEQVKLLSPNRPPRTLVVYGGTSINTNLSDLKKQVDIVVGTPGRILDLIERGALNLSDVKLAVLDEVDRMLDIGFRDDIRRIMAEVADSRQTIFVSATLSKEIRNLAFALMHEPVEVNVSADRLTVDQIHQEYVTVHAGQKLEALQAFLDRTSPFLAIVFTRTKYGASKVARKLARAKVECTEIHGGLTQARRTRVMHEIRRGKHQVLVATDVASRGLDVDGVSHIVNYDIPEDPESYVHRIGRTARMGSTGHALTLVTPEQGRELTDIECLINRELKQIDASELVKQTTEEPRQRHAAPSKPPFATKSTRQKSHNRKTQPRRKKTAKTPANKAHPLSRGRRRRR